MTAFKRHDDGAPDGSFPVSNSTDHETLYRTIYESTAVGICMTDLAGRITQCNEAYQKMLGYSADELTKLNFRDLTLPEDLPNNVALIEQLVAGERERIDIQKRYLRKDSSICWVEMNVSLLRNSAGEIYATLTVAHDVTERKIAEQTRDISEENYRNLFDNAHDSIFVLNPNDLTFVDVNENAAIRLGYTRDELRQLRLPDICPPGSEARMSKLLRQIRDQGEIRFEATHVRKDGTPMPVEIASRRVEFNGRFVLQSIVRDISERKQAEQARDSSQEKYKSLFNNAHDSIFVIDPADLSFIDVNDNAARRLGYTRDELRQLNLADIKRPESAAIAHDSVQRDISSGENKFEAVHVRKDGTHMPVDVATRRLEIDGRFVLQSIVRDISERKVAEKALRGSESRFRSLFEDAVIGIAIADDEGRMVQVNPAWSNMLGYGLDEMVGMKWPAVSHPDDIAENRHLSDDLFRGERSNYQLEKRYVRKDGKILWARLTVSLLDDDLTTDRLTLAMIEDITEHKKVEIALSDSRSLLEHAQQMARFGSLDIDYDSDIVTWSDEVYRMIGVARSDYDGRPSSYLEFVHPDEREWVAQQAEALRNGKDMEYTYRMIRTDGEERIVHVRGMVTRFVDGVPRQARGFIQDITELKEKENALRESEARLMEAQQLAQIGSWTWDIARDLIYWSAEHFRIFGRDPDGSESSYDEFLAMLHIDDREAVTAAVDVAIRSLGSYEFEYRFVRPDGEVRVAHAMGTVEADEAGKPIRMLGTVQDITERKNAAEAIAESEAHLNQAQRIAHIGSWEFNAHTEQLTWSDEVYRTFGVQPKEFRPTIKGYLDCVHPDDRDDLIRNIKNSAEGAGETTNNYRIVRPNGEIRSIREVTVVHTDADRKLIRRAGTVQDITEQVNTEEQLRQAQKMEAVGQLTGGVAHDFNNLLTVILGNLELIGERVDADAAVRGLIERAIKASERGASLTHQLLSYSRKQTLLPTNIDLGQLATGMTEMLSRTLGVAIEIRTRGQTSLWRCHADPSQLENALLNLALNARDAMAGGGRVTIETENISLGDPFSAAKLDVEPGDYIILSVSDGGCGIASENLKHVFEPFFTTKEVGAGSGLGLSMVYGFAKQSGGNVTIDSELGVGTTVKLYLPRSKSKSDEAASSRARPPIPLAQGERIFVVEDDVEVRRLAVATLSGLGYKVVEAGSAEEALEKIQLSAPIDLLLSDVVLPGAMNGPDLAAEIRRSSPATKIVHMTGYAKDSFRGDAELGEQTPVVQKPFKRAELANVIRSALDNA